MGRPRRRPSNSPGQLLFRMISVRKSLLVSAVLLPVSLAAQCSSTLYSSGTYGTAQGASGTAQYVVYMPQPATCFNGDVIVFAHGYIAQGSPSNAWLSQSMLPDGTSIPGLVNSLGFGFAASGFSKDGLAILQGIQDTNALTNVIQGLSIPVHKYFVAGASEGGLIAAKLVEESTLFAGGVAVCGPIGDFQKQINYFADVRDLFDYFFPGVLTSAGGSAVEIPTGLLANWTTTYEPAVVAALKAKPMATRQLMRTAGISIGRSPQNAENAITGALWYNAFATNDAVATLGGNPYGNIGRVYRESFNDASLNAQVARFAESSAAMAQIQNYQTTGLLGSLSSHYTRSPTRSFPLGTSRYTLAKAQAASSSSELTQITAISYGHCNITAPDAEAAVLALLIKAGL